MELKPLMQDFSVCKVADYSQAPLDAPFCFTGRTDEECSLVCLTKAVPSNVTHRDDGWKAFRIEGVLDFSLVGILSRMSNALAQAHVGIFAVSTYNTDYLLVKAEDLAPALEALAAAGFEPLSNGEEY